VRRVLSIAHIETGRSIKGASGGLPDTEKGTTKVIWEWERVDMVIGRDNMGCKPKHLRRWPKEGFPLEIMGPLDLEELNWRDWKSLCKLNGGRSGEHSCF
jgi:hypothetical protein